MDISASDVIASEEKSKDEFVQRLNLMYMSDEELKDLRSQLFERAVETGLADSGDALVGRRETGGGKTVKQKYIDDVWTLAGAIRKRKSVPRTLQRMREVRSR